MKIYGHRGYSAKYPENTMLGFRKAVEIGADGIELDVQLSCDGVPVIFHDERMERMTGKGGLLRDFCFKELKNEFIHHDVYKERIPSLEEYLDYIKDFPFITNIEIKNSIIKYESIEEKVLDLIRKFGVEDRVILSSFNHKSLRKIKEISPAKVCGLLTSDVLYDPAEYIRKIGCEYYHPVFYTLDQNISREMKLEDIKINTWTINTEDELKFLSGMVIDGIITNAPSKFIEK